MVSRDFELNPDEMVAKMSNVGSRAADLSREAIASFQPGSALGLLYQDRALSLVAECAQLGCPPPVELIEALYLIFEPNLDRRASAADRTRIAGADEAGLQRRYQQRLIANAMGVKVNMPDKFQRAAAAEVEKFDPATNTFHASVNSVSVASGAAHKSIKAWRDKAKYRDLVRQLGRWDLSSGSPNMPTNQ